MDGQVTARDAIPCGKKKDNWYVMGLQLSSDAQIQEAVPGCGPLFSSSSIKCKLKHRLLILHLK